MEKIQTDVVNCAGNVDKIHIRDLLYEGSKYPNTTKAFQNFQADLLQVENLGVVDLANVSPEGDEGEDHVEPEDEEPTLEDIAVHVTTTSFTSCRTCSWQLQWE